MAETITKNHIKTEVRRIVIETIQDVLSDPDFGLEIQGWVKERLKKRPKRTIPFEKLKEKYR